MPRAGSEDTGELFLGARLVNVTVTVTDSDGKMVNGLSREQFEVFDNDVRQQIAHFSDDDAPLSLGIVYDLSASMKNVVGRSLGALKRVMETSHHADEFFMVTFNSRVTLTQDFTTSADLLVNHLSNVEARGTTALYDAAYYGVQKLKEGRYPKKVLLLISDGDNNTSRRTYNDLSELVQESDVQIYAIGVASAMSGIFPSQGQITLNRITKMAGGRAFFTNPSKEDELLEICTRMATELRHQYSIGFYPTDTSSSARRRTLKIRANPRGGEGRFRLSYRKGYSSFEK